MILKQDLQVDGLAYFFIKREASEFYTIFQKKDYGFSTEDFFILLRSHLLMRGYKLVKIDKYLNLINDNIQMLAQITRNKDKDE